MRQLCVVSVAAVSKVLDSPLSSTRAQLGRGQSPGLSPAEASAQAVHSSTLSELSAIHFEAASSGSILSPAIIFATAS